MTIARDIKHKLDRKNVSTKFKIQAHKRDNMARYLFVCKRYLMSAVISFKCQN